MLVRDLVTLPSQTKSRYVLLVNWELHDIPRKKIAPKTSEYGASDRGSDIKKSWRDQMT